MHKYINSNRNVYVIFITHVKVYLQRIPADKKYCFSHSRLQHKLARGTYI